VVWLEALESATQSFMGGGGGLSAMVLKVLPRDCGSHSLDHGVLDGDCYGGARGKSWGTRGGMNGGLACCIGEP
jgi:hypothetical protein